MPYFVVTISPLHSACAAHGCPVDIRLASNETPLLMAVRTGCMGIVQLCLENGAHFEPDAEHGELFLCMYFHYIIDRMWSTVSVLYYILIFMNVLPLRYQ